MAGSAVVACPDSKYKKLWVVSAYISNNKDSQVTQEYDVETPYSTPKASLASPTAVATNVPQPAQVVKRSDSDIAQIESVISEARRDKEEMYSDFDGQEAPKNVQQEIKCSTRFNEEYMDAAIARNEKLPLKSTIQIRKDRMQLVPMFSLAFAGTLTEILILSGLS